MGASISITITTGELRLLVKELISEYFAEQSKKDPDRYLVSQNFILDNFYIKPERLKEWKDRGLINEYPGANIVKFKISELFEAIDQVMKENKEQKEDEKKPEVVNG